MKTWIACGVIVLFQGGLLLGWEIGAAALKPNPQWVPVFVATADLPSGICITNPEQYYTIVTCPPGFEPPGGIRHPDQVRDKVVVRAIKKGQPFVFRNLVVREAWNAQQRGGHGFFTVPVAVGNWTSLASLPGSYVELNCTWTYQPTRKRITETVLSRVLVAAVDRTADSSGCFAVTFLIEPEAAPRLQQYKDQGTLVID